MDNTSTMDVRKLNIMTFPQRWTGNEIIANLLLLPSGDPTQAVGSEAPFSQAHPVLRAKLLRSLDLDPWDQDAYDQSEPLPLYYLLPGSPTEHPGLLQPTFKSELFDGLQRQFNPTASTVRIASDGGVKKDLPQTYLAEVGSSTSDPTLFASAGEYGCDLLSTPPNTDQPGSTTMAWGEVFSYALRQPLFGQAIGIMYLDVHIRISDPNSMIGGGWLWVEIDNTNDDHWYATLVNSAASEPAYQQPVRYYAARIPPLVKPQNVFAAVLFPTYKTMPNDESKFDDAQIEADVYAEGFAQVVHAYQPDSADATIGDDPTLVPGTDAGIQIGWDDEQVTVWLQRQVQTAQDMVRGDPTDELPLAVHGYRVDARQVTEGNADPTWNSLVAVDATISALDGAYSATAQSEELCVEPTPVSNGGSGNFWLPRYFAHWRGRSLVVNDQYAYAFSGGQDPKAYPQNPSLPTFSGSLEERLTIDLRYGNTYQFRTRLADLTGRGPTVDSTASDAGMASIQFRRYIPPKAVKVEIHGPKISPSTITVYRPQLNYPEMVFAGAATEATLENLLNQLNSLPESQTMQVSVPDPDVVTLEIIVETQAPAHDTGNPASMSDMSSPPNKGDLDGTFRVVYSYRVPFTGPSVTLNIEAVPCSHVASLSAPSSSQLPSHTCPSDPCYALTVPTERNLRIRIRALGNESLVGSYWGNTQGKRSCTGLVTDVQVRYETPSSIIPSDPIILEGKVAQQLQGFYLREDPAAPQQAVISAGVSQTLPSTPPSGPSGSTPPPGIGLQESLATSFQTPASDPIEKLAQALNLSVNGQTLTCEPGRRVLFGAQNTLRYSVTQDLSSITFSSLKDLIGHWIVAIRLTLDRDWTYNGIAQNGPGQTGFVFSEIPYLGLPTPIEVGRINLPTVVSALATQPTGEDSQRESTDIIFFATVDSTVAPGDFPDIINTSWTLDATFTNAPTTSIRLWNGSLRLPVTLSPQQTPRLVSAGLAESPYKPDPEKYAFTEQRQRALWLEFDSPPADPRDEYYYRVLGYGPDPLLITEREIEGIQGFLAQIEPPLQIDPEWIRVIAPGDTNDDAGLSAMTKLIPAKAPLNQSGKPVHYLVPLPNSLSPTSLDLFGFWTIELRVGHGKQVWSTAQARYGRPLRVSGVQFPPPPLTLSVERQKAIIELPPTWIAATACLAQTVYNGVPLTFSEVGLPTAIWFLLYAQVHRVDGLAWRNILIDKVMGEVMPSQDSTTNMNIQVMGRFLQSEVDAALRRLLPTTERVSNIPLSVLAVELLHTWQPKHFEGQKQESTDNQGDPLGSQLGMYRILRVSPLTAVREICS